MKNTILKKIILCFVVVTALSFASCSDSFLDTKDPNKEVDVDFWKKESNAYSSLASVYSPIRWQMYGPYGAYDGIQTQNGRADDTWLILQEEKAIADISFFLNTPTTGYDNFDVLYTCINRANVFLRGIDQTPMNETLKNQWIGEVKFLRGFAYYMLAREFGSVPLRLIPASVDPTEAMKASSLQSVIWEQVESDFKDAKAVLPVTRDSKELGRVTQGAAIAFLGKAYLYQGKYDLAESELTLILDGRYDLVDNPDDNFTEFTEFNKESVFELVYDGSYNGGLWYSEGTATLGCVYPTFLAPEGTGGWFKIMPSSAIVEEFLKEERPAGSDSKFDKRMYTSFYFKHSDYGDTVADESWYGGMSFDDIWTACATKRGKGQPEFPVINGREGRFLMKKFTNFYLNQKDANSMYGASAQNNNLRVMRFAEVLLLHAEACLKHNNLAGATSDLQRIRRRAGLAEKTWANATELWEEMEHQKFLELYFEGQRFYDLRRWYSFDEMKNLFVKNKKQGAVNFQQKHYYLPIPQTELNTNDVIVQNDAWK